MALLNIIKAHISNKSRDQQDSIQTKKHQILLLYFCKMFLEDKCFLQATVPLNQVDI